MVTERIVGPGGCIIFDIYETDYFQDITSYYCPRCKKEQAIPSDIVYDFTKGKNSHPGGENLFVCTNCGTPMKPKEKE